MRVEDLIVYGKKYISSSHAKLLLADLLKKNPLELLLILDQTVEPQIVEEYQKRVKALKENYPIQYVIGHVNFYGYEFFVNKDVLIPRFETEELVERIIHYAQNCGKKDLTILDLGCGSGCIGITLKKKLPSAEVTLVDYSEKALSVAKKNAEELKADVFFYQSDWFSNLPVKQYDIIVSNPPYIRTTEKIEEIVQKNEPSLALYGGEDGLNCYRTILQNSLSYQTDHTLFAFEIGYEQASLLTEIVEKIYPDRKVVVEKDMQGRNRMLFVLPKNE